MNLIVPYLLLFLLFMIINLMLLFLLFTEIILKIIKWQKDSD